MEDPFVNVPDAIEVISRGGMVIVCDDADQESEGNLMMAAELVTAEEERWWTDERGMLAGEGFCFPPGLAARRAGSDRPRNHALDPSRCTEVIR